MIIARAACLATALLAAPITAQAAPVLMISVDGLRPGDVLDADARGLKLPVLRGLVANGAYASGVRNVLPTVTYPNHTTIITGVWPSRHGIPNNVVFDPLQKNMGGWYWYARDIKVPTLWDAVHKSGGKVASFSWPVSVGADSIDYNIPEYWRARLPEDLKLLRAVSTKGLVDELEKSTGLTLAQTNADTAQTDGGRARFAAALIAARKPHFTTVHLSALDHAQHDDGPGSGSAKTTLEALDAVIGKLIADARKAQPDLVVALVSDHGFAEVKHNINLVRPFAEAGLLTLDPATRKPTRWDAAPWGGASVAVVLSRPQDAALKAKVAGLLDRLAAKPELGIARILDAKAIAQIGGTPMASFWVDFKPGYQMGQDPAAPLIGPGSPKGMHGYVPTHPEMRATLIIAGPGIPKKALGEVDMRDIAPTLAKLMKVSLPSADGKPLF